MVWSCTHAGLAPHIKQPAWSSGDERNAAQNICTRSCPVAAAKHLLVRSTAPHCDGVSVLSIASCQGHEDLRQDERVMQLFGLVNNMLTADRSTAEQDLSIARYAVIPLSPNSGMPTLKAGPC